MPEEHLFIHNGISWCWKTRYNYNMLKNESSATEFWQHKYIAVMSQACATCKWWNWASNASSIISMSFSLVPPNTSFTEQVVYMGRVTTVMLATETANVTHSPFSHPSASPTTPPARQLRHPLIYTYCTPKASQWHCSLRQTHLNLIQKINVWFFVNETSYWLEIMGWH